MVEGVDARSGYEALAQSQFAPFTDISCNIFWCSSH